MMIEKLSVVTAMGSKCYSVGHEIGGKEIAKIELSYIRFTGDPYDHYCGYDDKGKMLFSVNCLVPCEIEYS